MVRCHATEYVSRLDLCKYYSLYGNMWKLILQSQTLSLCSKSSMKYMEEEPALQCWRQYARRTRSHWRLVRGLLRESWIRGCSGSRIIPLAGLQDYEDTRLKTLSRVRMGLSLAWKESLAMRIFKISYYCNRLYVTLTLFGVYINRRVLVRRTTYRTTIIP